MRAAGAVAAETAVPSWWRVARWLLPVAAAVAPYWAALGNGFVWDDPLVLRQLDHIRSWRDLLIVPPEIPRFYYRPVVFASYLLDLSLAGEQPFCFHASVVAWHAVASVLVLAVAARLFRGAFGGGAAAKGVSIEDAFAVTAAVLFAVHPAHVESVAWMAGRSDVIAGALALGAMAVYQRPGRRNAWLGAGCMLLAVLAKEPVVLTIAVLPALDRALGRTIDWRRYVPFGGAMALYFALRQIGVGMVGEPIPAGMAPLSNVVLALGFYLGKTVLPVTQTVYYSEVPSAPIYFFLGALAALGLGAGLAWAWVRRRGVVLFGIVWCAVTLAPAMTVVLRRIATAPVAERYVYVPSAGWTIMAAYGLGALAARTGRVRTVLAVAAALGVAGGIEIARRNAVWADDLRFWTAAAAASPDATPQRELGDAYLRRGRLDEAQRAYEAAQGRPANMQERAVGLANLGNLYRRRDRIDEAVDAFRRAIAIREHPSINHGLGLALMRKAELAQAAGDGGAVRRAVIEARRAFERAIAIGTAADAPPAFREWERAKTYLLLAQVLLSLGERESARRYFGESLRLEPRGTVGDTARKFLEQTEGGTSR